MKGFLKKAKAEFDGVRNSKSDSRTDSPSNNQQPSYTPSPNHPSGHLRGMEHDQPSTIQEPTPIDILRYRYHHGTNLGSVYVLEKWLSPSRFPEGASGTSELEAVKAWVAQIGIDATRQKFEDAWANAVSDSNIQWLLNEAKCTTIRLPIGYYCLDPSFVDNTPFEPYKAVYARAWSSIWTLISRLRAHSIGTLLDLHALPGGANCGEHSGTNSGKCQLWGSRSNRDLGIRCCEFLAHEVRKGLEVTGIQVVNEADYHSERMYEWYDHCIDTISRIDATIPVIISDGWNLNKAVDYSLKKNVVHPDRPTCPVIIDTHYYWIFSDADKSKSPQQIIADVSTKMGPLNAKEGSVMDRGAVQVIVGEYSCVLSEDSWSKSGGTPKQDLVKQFGEAQSKKYQQRSGGSFFWTWKMDWYPGGEWGFAAQTQNRAITPHPVQSVPQSLIQGLVERAQTKRDERMYNAVNQHVSYWDHLSPDMPAEHWRYENGWKLGYQDALVFFQGRPQQGVASGNKLGNVEVWVLKRIRESGFRGKFVWEFEQGLRRGIQDFYGIVGFS